MRGMCRSSCELTKDECDTFCKRLVRELPPETRPTRVGAVLDEEGVGIQFTVLLPKVTKGPFPIMRTRSFGIIEKAQNVMWKNVKYVQPYAIEMNEETMELDHHICHMMNKLAVCKEDAVLPESCLSQAPACSNTRIPTSRSCSFAYLSHGIAIYAAEVATVRSLTRNAPSTVNLKKWTGVKYIPYDSDDKVIDCGEDILVPRLNTEKIIDKEIEMEQVEMGNFSVTPWHPHMVELEDRLKKHMHQRVENNNQESNDRLNRDRWIMLAVLVVIVLAFGGLSIAVFLQKKMIQTQQAELEGSRKPFRV